MWHQKAKLHCLAVCWYLTFKDNGATLVILKGNSEEWVLECKELNIITTFKNMWTYWRSIPETLSCFFLHISLSHRLSNLLCRHKSNFSSCGGCGYKFLSSVSDTSSTPWSYVTFSRHCEGLSVTHLRLLNTRLLCQPQLVTDATYLQRCQPFLKALCLLWGTCAFFTSFLWETPNKIWMFAEFHF